MKRFLSVLLILLVAVLPCAYAIEQTPYDYVFSQGFSIAEKFESPGWRTCYMQENSENQTIVFSDNENAYIIVAVPALDMHFDATKMRDLFFSLVSFFEWDVSFYQPDTYASDKFAVSYGITKDLSRTLSNHMDMVSYRRELGEHLGMSSSEIALSALGVKGDVVNGWFSSENLLPDKTIESTPSDPQPCATFLISPQIVITQTGNSDYVSYSFQTSLTDSEVMSMFGRLIDYIRENSAAVYASGFCTGPVTYDVLAVATLSDTSSYTGIYNILTEKFTIEYEQTA